MIHLHRVARCLFLGLLSLGSVAEPATLAVEPRQPRRPNVLVIFTDDHGWTDLGAQSIRSDVKTPNLDALARDGVRFHRGYVTAPQCVPSRAGLLTGRYQQRFGVDDNLKGPLPRDEKTIANRFHDAGYVTGMVGKWHLDIRQVAGPNVPPAKRVQQLPNHLPHQFGFSEYFCGNMRRYHASHDLEGRPLPNPPQIVIDERFRVDVQTEAALSFIGRNAEKPFFLYLAYFAPHVPLEAPDSYKARFSEASNPTRRTGLAMISAVDDGVGRIRSLLRERNLEQDTLIFFISDNGAPTKPNAWDGSLNEPLVGEKGMLTDGGVRVPFVAAWPGKLEAGKVYGEPVISLDVLPTALAAAGVAVKPEWRLDGVNLLPSLMGERDSPPHGDLFWRWRSQASLLSGRWKLVYLAPGRWRLFDTTTPEGELDSADLSAKEPDRLAAMKRRLLAWDATLKVPGLPKNLNPEDKKFFDDHVNQIGRAESHRPGK